MKKGRIVLASIIGNALEFYNLTVIGFFAAQIGTAFFPGTDPLLTLLKGLGAFAAGFVMRPFGAYVFGYIGDILGRKVALGLSIILMGVPTVLIAFLPSYGAIGISAPIILILCRLLQGLCTGGEYNGAAIFVLEHVGKNRPGMFSGMIVGSCLLGALFATLVGLLTLYLGLGENAWRYAFLIGALATPIGYYIRKNMDESPAFKKLKKEKHISKTPLRDSLTKHRKSFWQVFAIGAFDGILAYTLMVFLNLYVMSHLGWSQEKSILFSMLGLFSCMVFCPVFGLVSDRIGVKRTLYISCTFILLMSFPVFYLITEGTPFSVGLGQILMGLITASLIGIQPVFSQNLFPAEDRYSGISFSFSLGGAIGGGTTPVLLTFLISKTENLYIPSFYLCTVTIAFLIILGANKKQ